MYQPDALLAATTSTDGNLDDLPPEAVRTYLQYLIQFTNISCSISWGDIDFEHEFTNIFRIVGVSMLPDEADTSRDAQYYNFERLIRSLSKATGGILRDLAVEIDKDNR